MSLITLDDIYELTGLSDSSLVSLIPYGEAQAKAFIGFLEEETKEAEIFIEDTVNEINLKIKPITSIESISYTTSSTSGSTIIENYRLIKSKGLVLLDQTLNPGTIVTVNYKVGWNKNNVPLLVKLLIVLLVINQYYSLYPDKAQTSNVIVQERIGDYMVKYSGYVKGTVKSWDERIADLVELIKGGSIYPSVE